MKFKITYQRIVIIVLIASSLISYTNTPTSTISTSTPPHVESTSTSPVNTSTPTNTAIPTASATPAFITDYAFPDSIEPANQYLSYLHGKIIEDQGIPAVSPDFGEYEYEAILERLSGFGFVVISEQRPKNADGVKYARMVVAQIEDLLDAGVPAKISLLWEHQKALALPSLSHTSLRTRK